MFFKRIIKIKVISYTSVAGYNRTPLYCQLFCPVNPTLLDLILESQEPSDGYAYVLDPYKIKEIEKRVDLDTGEKYCLLVQQGN